MKAILAIAVEFLLLHSMQGQQTCVKLSECEVESSLIEYEGQDEILREQLKDRLRKLDCSPENATEVHIYCPTPIEEIIIPEEDDDVQAVDEPATFPDYGIRNSGGVFDSLHFATRQGCSGDLKLYYFNQSQNSVRILNLKDGSHSKIPISNLADGFFFQAKASGSCCWQLCSRKYFRGSRVTLNPGFKLQDVSVESAKVLNC